jgi:hypothetical protein
MAEGRIKNTELSAIAAAIRSKNGESTVYKPGEMAQAILDISGGSAVIESKSITANGTYTAPTGVDGYSPVVVDVQPNLQSKTATENGTVTPDTGYDGLSSVVVDVSVSSGNVVLAEEQHQSGGTFSYSKNITITEAGTYIILAMGYLDTLSIKINGVDQSAAFRYSPDYIWVFNSSVTLSVNDVIAITSSSTGYSAIVVSITKEGS